MAARAATESAQHPAREQELAESLLADTLCSASLALAGSLDLDTVLSTLLDYLAVLVPYDGANVCLLEAGPAPDAQARPRLSPRITRGWEQHPGGEPGSRPCQGRTLTAQAWQRLDEPLGAARGVLIGGEGLAAARPGGEPGWEPCQGLQYAQSAVVVPLAVDGRTIGLCELAKREPGFYTRQHLRWVEALAGQAEVAIRNAQLYEQVRREREQLQSLSRHLVEVQESERRRIAHELHDEANQALTTLKVRLRLLERQADQPEAVRQGAGELSRLVEGVMEDLHRLAVGLRPPSLDHLGLAAALGQHCQALSEQHGLAIEWEAVGLDRADRPGPRPRPEVETALYRIVQEALLNAVRHAGASRLRVRLERQPGRVLALVEDDGQGFDPALAAHRAVNEGRLGLLGMRERAEALGGRVTMDSAPGSGTTVRVEVPSDD